MAIGPKAEAALAALQSGNIIDDVTTEVADIQVESEPEQVDTTEDTIQDGVQESTNVADVLEGDETSEPQTESDVEEIVVNGKKLKLDYSDRDTIKKYAKQAGGFRKMQVERDSLKVENQITKAELAELKRFETTIESAYADDGFEGLARVVAGSQEEYQKWLSGEVDKEIAKRGASPQELEQIEMREQLQRERREREKLQREREQEREERTKFQETQEIAKLQSNMNASFDKWRFSGKLGDSELEDSIDSMVWEKAKAVIAQIPDDQQLTKRDYDNAFRQAANSFRKFAKKEGSTVAKGQIENSKKLAATKAVALASKGPAVSNTNEEVRNRIKSGDIKGSFAAFMSGITKTK